MHNRIRGGPDVASQTEEFLNDCRECAIEVRKHAETAEMLQSKIGVQGATSYFHRINQTLDSTRRIDDWLLWLDEQSETWPELEALYEAQLHEGRRFVRGMERSVSKEHIGAVLHRRFIDGCTWREVVRDLPISTDEAKELVDYAVAMGDELGIAWFKCRGDE
jgi:hypothetical protein